MTLQATFCQIAAFMLTMQSSQTTSGDSTDALGGEELQRDQLFTSRDRHPPNEAARYVENHVALPGRPRAVFSERKGDFVLPTEANSHIEERL
jgi:hypothetical protein